MLEEDIKQYVALIAEFKRLDSSNYVDAYKLAQLSLMYADRWNEIMLDSVKYSKELDVTKSDFVSYAYQKYKILMKIHDFTRMVYRQGSYGITNNFYNEDM